MEGAKGVTTEGSVGLAVLEQGLLLVSVSSRFLTRGCRLRGLAVAIEVPRWRGEVLVESGGIKGVVAVGLVRGGSQVGRCFSHQVVVLLILLTGTWR